MEFHQNYSEGINLKFVLEYLRRVSQILAWNSSRSSYTRLTQMLLIKFVLRVFFRISDGNCFFPPEISADVSSRISAGDLFSIRNSWMTLNFNSFNSFWWNPPESKYKNFSYLVFSTCYFWKYSSSLFKVNPFPLVLFVNS